MTSFYTAFFPDDGFLSDLNESTEETGTTGETPTEGDCIMTLTGELEMEFACSVVTSTDTSMGVVTFGIIGVDESYMQVQTTIEFTDNIVPNSGTFYQADLEELDAFAFNPATFEMYEAEEESCVLTIISVEDGLPTVTFDSTMISS